jgi:hypothetical protein
MYQFLSDHRQELLQRCRAMFAQHTQHPLPMEADPRWSAGLPIFLEQLIRTLRAEKEGRTAESLRISGPEGGDLPHRSEIGQSAAAYGAQMMELGYTIDQVVHAYGDICQAIAELALAERVALSVEEFRTVNRCVDNAVADAVAEFCTLHDARLSNHYALAFAERLGFLVHELRNGLQTASLALTALERGNTAVRDATVSVLKRSLITLGAIVAHSIEEVRQAAEPRLNNRLLCVADLVSEAGDAAQLQANARGCSLTVVNVERGVYVEGNPELLLAALSNLLQNAFKFTAPGTEVRLHAHADADGKVRIDVSDRCGGLPPGAEQSMFSAFKCTHTDRSGLGLGLSIARSNVEDAGGTLTVRDVPGVGCVFTITLARVASAHAEGTTPPG